MKTEKDPEPETITCGFEIIPGKEYPAHSIAYCMLDRRISDHGTESYLRIHATNCPHYAGDGVLT